MSLGAPSSSGQAPPEILSAVLEAAEAANIGVTVTAFGPLAPRVLYVNEAASRVLGFPREELLVSDPFSTMGPEDRRRLEACRARSLGDAPNESRFEASIVRKNGERGVVEITCGRLLGHGEPLVVSFFVDVTHRRAAEDALLASEARFRSIIDGAPDGVVLSRNGEVLFANARAAAVLGLTSGTELKGRSLAEFLSPEGMAEMRDRIQRSARGEVLAPLDYTALRSDGAKVTAEITSIPIEYEGERAVLAFARDTTSVALLREQLARSERLASIGTLAAGVAHEINNPLAYVNLGIEALRRSLQAVPIDEKQRASVDETIGRVLEGVERIATIVRGLNTFSRTDRIGVAKVLLESLVQAATDASGSQVRARAKLLTEIEDSRLSTRGDASRLEQVLVALLVNAAESFDVASAEARVLVRACRARPGWVAVHVQDNGRGIPEESIDRVVDPFFTTKSVGVGAGLGLSIAHEIITQHGGELHIESVPDEGTLVSVLLPADEGP